MSHLAKWDGTSWSALGSGTTNWVFALLTDDRDFLYAGGNFTTAGEKMSAFIARWGKFGLHLPLILDKSFFRGRAHEI